MDQKHPRYNLGRKTSLAEGAVRVARPNIFQSAYAAVTASVLATVTAIAPAQVGILADGTTVVRDPTPRITQSDYGNIVKMGDVSIERSSWQIEKHGAFWRVGVFFNDPLPTPDPAKRAIEMAVKMRATTQALLGTWRRRGHDIGFGVGISQGYATLGQIRFAERVDYTAIGTVTNLAARLCAEAKDGQILISARVAIAVEDSATLEEIGDLSLKGLSEAVAVYNVVAVGTQPSAS